MNSAKTVVVLLGLILALTLGLRRPVPPDVWPDQVDLADLGGSAGSTRAASSGRVTTSNPCGPGADEPTWEPRSVRWGHAPDPEVPPFEPPTHPGAPDLPLLVRGLESALTLEEQASWADGIARSGGPAAVEALVQASLHRRSVEEAEVLHEAFKGFSTEAEMEALAIGLSRTDDPDLIEALVESLARGARSSTVERLALLHEEASPSPATRAVLGWAIERIRNPEAAEALGRWVWAPEPPDWADAGIIALSALSALQSPTDAAAAPSP